MKLKLTKRYWFWQRKKMQFDGVVNIEPSNGLWDDIRPVAVRWQDCLYVTPHDIIEYPSDWRPGELIDA